MNYNIARLKRQKKTKKHSWYVRDKQCVTVTRESLWKSEMIDAFNYNETLLV